MTQDLPLTISSDDDLNRVAVHWIALGRKIVSIDEQPAVAKAKAIIAKAAVEKQSLQKLLEESREFYEPKCEKYAARALRGKAVRTYKATLLEISFTACNQISVDVVDQVAALPLIEEQCPDAIERRPHVLKSLFSDEFRVHCAELSRKDRNKFGIVVKLPHDKVSFKLCTPKVAA